MEIIILLTAISAIHVGPGQLEGKRMKNKYRRICEYCGKQLSTNKHVCDGCGAFAVGIGGVINGIFGVNDDTGNGTINWTIDSDTHIIEKFGRMNE